MAMRRKGREILVCALSEFLSAFRTVSFRTGSGRTRSLNGLPRSLLCKQKMCHPFGDTGGIPRVLILFISLVRFNSQVWKLRPTHMDCKTTPQDNWRTLRRWLRVRGLSL